jgi:8-oxo-dGTP pyrophosphatase MutT (NUDIX family)
MKCPIILKIWDKSIWCLLCTLVLTLLSQNAYAACNAGTVLYFKFNGEAYLLLADHSLSSHSRRGWSGFGGRCDGELADKTAARETEEETRGFYKREEILDKLSSSPRNLSNGFTTFFVEVGYVPAIVFNNQKPTSHAASYDERGPYAWVPFSAIWQAIENERSGQAHIPKKYLPPNAHTDWLFKDFVLGLIEAKRAGDFP